MRDAIYDAFVSCYQRNAADHFASATVLDFYLLLTFATSDINDGTFLWHTFKMETTALIGLVLHFFAWTTFRHNRLFTEDWFATGCGASTLIFVFGKLFTDWITLDRRLRRTSAPYTGHCQTPTLIETCNGVFTF